MTFTLTKFVEKSSYHNQDFPFAIKNELDQEGNQFTQWKKNVLNSGWTKVCYGDAVS